MGYDLGEMLRPELYCRTTEIEPVIVRIEGRDLCFHHERRPLGVQFRVHVDGSTVEPR